MNLSVDYRTPLGSLYAKQIINLMIAPSCEYGACWLAVKYGLGTALAGHVSAQKLASATRLPRARVDTILAEWRKVITRANQ